MRNQKKQKACTPEFSRMFDVGRLAPGGGEVHENIGATEGERGRLAARMGLVAIPELKAELRLKRLGGKKLRVRVAGHLHADVVQTCVVTLEPVPEEVDEAFTIVFTDEQPEGGELGLDLEDDREPADFADGKLDLGEMVAQHLSLALNPYPRKKDATIASVWKNDAEGEGFPALSALDDPS